jgi:hypothetical protein
MSKRSFICTFIVMIIILSTALTLTAGLPKNNFYFYPICELPLTLISISFELDEDGIHVEEGVNYNSKIETNYNTEKERYEITFESERNPSFDLRRELEKQVNGNYLNTNHLTPRDISNQYANFYLTGTLKIRTWIKPDKNTETTFEYPIILAQYTSTPYHYWVVVPETKNRTWGQSGLEIWSPSRLNDDESKIDLEQQSSLCIDTHYSLKLTIHPPLASNMIEKIDDTRSTNPQTQ